MNTLMVDGVPSCAHPEVKIEWGVGCCTDKTISLRLWIRELNRKLPTAKVSVVPGKCHGFRGVVS